MKYVCNDCEGKPCILLVPEGKPDVCPFPGDDGGAHTCNWEPMKDRRAAK